MAGQVKDWVYKKIDWAYSTGAWEWSVNVATTAELFKLFSSTVIFKDHANVYDNKHYGLVSKYDGLMIRPITGSNGYTGVMHFHLYNENDRYYSDLEGLYGEFTLRDLVLMVFKACGLMVSEARRTYWLNQVLSLMITLPAERSWVCNTSIRRAGGYQVAAYVDKSIVDDIIACMKERGMFNFEKNILNEVVINTTYHFSPDDNSIDDMIDDVYDFIVNNPVNDDIYDVMNATRQGLIDNLLAGISPTLIKSDIHTLAEDNNIDLTEEWFITVTGSLRLWFNNSPRIAINVYLFKFDNDTYTATNNSTKEDMSDSTDVDITYEGYRLLLPGLLGSLIDRHHLSTGYLSNPSFSRENYGHDTTDYYQYISDYTSVANPESGWSTAGQNGIFKYSTNYGYTKIGPEGVSTIHGAVAPNTSTSSSNFWPSWAARAVTVNAYSGSNHPSYTYIPVGYGDYDYEGFTQARVQSGWIYNDNYLQKLGLSMELLPEYEPIEPDPGDDEPIRPDPDPTPDPTPEEEEPLDLSANRLFTVHTLTNAEVNALGGFLYSSTFIEAIKNMFTEPMDAIIGCFILNYGSGGTIPTGSNETLKLGSVLGDSGVTGTRVTNQTFECSFGTVTIGEFYHNVEDYAPYSSAQIFLPYIGFCDLDINEIMNSSITLKYRFDVYTGACLARLFVRKNGVLQELYNFEGNSAVHIPLTGRDFTNSVSSLITGAVGVIGGAATGNPIASVMGAKSLMGSTIPTTRRSGSLSANIGVLGGQKPFILIKRPKAYNAAGYNSYYGYPSNWSVSLGDCSGYTRVKDVHLDALACTDAEREEIETLLREGVIF